MNRILADLLANIRIWRRSPTAVFFTIAFPLLLVFVFGTVFGADDAEFTLAVQDNDRSFQSRQLMAGLNATGALDIEIVRPGVDPVADAREEDRHSTLVIPADYGEALAARRPVELTFIADPSQRQSATVESIVRSVVQELNARMTGAPQRVTLETQAVRGAGGDYIDFVLPSIIGLTIMTNALIGGLELNASLRQAGILRKIATTPMRRWEWVVAKAAYQVFMALVTTAVLVIAGIVLFGVDLRWSWEALALIVLTGAGFAGLAMVLSRWVDKPDQANAAGSAVSFPMMFLAGTFFPLETMPGFLQAFARALPLTYVNEGLRAAMITGNSEAFWANGVVVLLFAVAAIALGAMMLKWKDL